MSGHGDGLSEILLLLGTRPDPTEVITALVSGPLAEFGARAGILTVAVGTDLAIVGDYGYPVEEVEPYRLMAIAGEFPITRSFREQAVLISAIPDVVPEYPGLQRDDDLWERGWARDGYGSLVSGPIVLQGRAIGAFGFSCNEDRQWTTLEIAALEAYGAALGLWLSHPGTEAVPTGMEVAPALTPRQSDILAMVAAGRSNAAIAAHLAVSDSTVKVELRRVYAALGVATRASAIERATLLGLLTP